MKPVLQALVLAEHVFQDRSGQMIIAGTFNGVVLRNPEVKRDKDGNELRRGGEAGSPWAYISLTDVVNNTELELQFVSLTKNKVLFKTNLRIECHDRLATIEMRVPLPRLPIVESGTYAFEVVYNGEILGSSRITASLEQSET